MRNAYYSSDDDEGMYAPPKRKPTPRRQQTTVQKALGFVRKNPKRVFGGAALLGVASVISLNALVMQHSRHPAPMFAQSSPAIRAAVAPAAPMQPPPRPPEMQAAAPAPVPAVAPAPELAPAVASAPPVPRDMIGDIIRTSSTATAPAQVQRAAAPSLLPPVRMAAAPVHAPRPAAVPRPPQRHDVIGDMIRSNKPETRPAPSAADDGRKRKIASVQQALNRLNYGPLPANGVMGTDTQKALKRFEFDRRLPVTGTLNPQTLAELAATSRVAIR